jgi:hypothetical protein
MASSTLEQRVTALGRDHGFKDCGNCVVPQWAGAIAESNGFWPGAGLVG